MEKGQNVLLRLGIWHGTQTGESVRIEIEDKKTGYLLASFDFSIAELGKLAAHQPTEAVVYFVPTMKR